MNVKQIANICNNMYSEITGEEAILSEDLSNIVDVGGTFLNKVGNDNFVKTLTDKVGRSVYVDRTYTRSAPNISREAWEYGSILEKVRCEVPEAVENPSWQLVKGQSVDPFIFNPPTVSAKYYNSLTTFEVDISITEMQVKESMRSASDLVRFVAMIENRVRTMLDMSNDNLIMRTIVNLICEKIAANHNVIDLLALYNETHTPTVTADNALNSKEFLRFALATIDLYSKYLTKPSTLYNEGGYMNFTPKEYQHLVLLSQFENAARFNLMADTYHEDLLDIGYYETVPFWQGTGTTAPTFTQCSTIFAKCASDNTNEVHRSHILGVMFDRDAAAVCNSNPRVKVVPVERQEFTNYFYKEDCSYLNDTNENVIVFTLGAGEIS